MPTPNHMGALLRLAPRGGVNYAEAGVAQSELAAVAAGMDALDEEGQALLREGFPALTTAAGLLASWERLLKLRAGVAVEAVRRVRVLARIRASPNLRPATIEEICNTWADMVSLEVVECGDARYDDEDSGYDDAEFLFDGVFCFFLEGDADEADSVDLDVGKLQAFLNTVKPAHMIAMVRFVDGFDYDEAWSRYDRDLLSE